MSSEIMASVPLRIRSGTGPSQRRVVRPSICLGSTTQRPSSSRVDRCTTSWVPSSPHAVTAAGITAEVLTTTRSPARRTDGIEPNVVCV